VTTTLELLLTVVASAITAVSTVLVVRRRHSGNIRTSEAETLWAESRAIRREQSKQLDVLYRRVEKLEEEKTQCQEQVESLQTQVDSLRKT